MIGCVPRISVIIPVHNAFDYLISCMGTVLTQTFSDYEIVLIDDGSIDGSSALCDEYAQLCPNVEVIHQANQGPSAARNAGIAHSSGELVVFVDSDDCVHPCYLEVLERTLRENDADLSMCQLARFNGKYPSYEEFAEPNEVTTKYTSDEAMDMLLKFNGNRTICYPCGRAFKREILEEEHFPLGICVGEDVEGMFKAILNSSTIAETNQCLYFYRNNSGSLTGRLFDDRYFQLAEVWDRVYSLAKQRRPDLADKVLYNRKVINFVILCNMLLYGDETTDHQFVSKRNDFLAQLRSDYHYLVNGPMPMNRKVLLTLVTFGYESCRVTKRIVDRIPKVG